MDYSIFREEIVDISSGHPNAGVHLMVEDLKNFLEAIVCDIAESVENESQVG